MPRPGKYDKYDISDSPYTQTMEEKTTRYNNLIRQAERTNLANSGKVSREEETYYYEATKVCEELMNMNISQPAVYSQWKLRKQHCEEQVRAIHKVIAPPPPPAQENPPEKAGPVKDHNSEKKADSSFGTVTMEDGFVTKNACDEVKAETIRKWHKDPPNHGFDDVTGMEDLKDRLINEAASLGWTHIDSTLGINPVQSYFFYGPPGTGKTYIIEAFAKELMDKGFHFIQLCGADIHDPYVGVAEKKVQIAFQEAIDNEPCIIFIDEVENVCVSRGGKSEGDENRLTVAFLEALTGLKNSGKRIIFMGATNHPGMVDEAMLSRIKLIRVPLPNEKAREAYFARKFKNLKLEDGLDFADMAAATDNHSYRDLDERLTPYIANMLKKIAIEQNVVTDNGGEMDQAQTDILGSEAIRSGKIILTRDMFKKAQEDNPPEPKFKIKAELEEFENNLMNM